MTQCFQSGACLPSEPPGFVARWKDKPDPSVSRQLNDRPKVAAEHDTCPLCLINPSVSSVGQFSLLSHSPLCSQHACDQGCAQMKGDNACQPEQASVGH